MILQRYAVGLWPMIRGDIPFIVRGPNFNAAGKMIAAMNDAFSSTDDREDLVRAAAELLLLEGVVSAAWSPLSTVDRSERMKASIERLAFEIPDLRMNLTLKEMYGEQEMLSKGFTVETDIGHEVHELLSGMSTKQHYESRLSSDSIELDELIPNNEVL